MRDVYRTIKLAAQLSMRRLREASPVPVTVTPNTNTQENLEGAASPESYYQWGDDEHIGLVDRRAFNDLAHEIGHAELQQTLPGKLLQNPVTRGIYFTSTAPTIFHGAFASPHSLPHQRLLRSALFNAILAGPTLASEGIASYKGYQKLKELGASSRQLNNSTDSLL
jgi:hypothetical protein